ncbi:MAG: hypothetical protein AAF497_23940, partial [Planctomycetota bacterium]
AGYGSSSGVVSRFRYSNTTVSPATWTEAEIFESALGPGSKPRHRELEWLPLAPSDEVEYFADVYDTLEEVDETNNEQTDILSRVNPNRPTASIALADPTMDGNTDPSIYGRYITQVPGVTTDVIIQASDPDGIDQLLYVRGRIPSQNDANPNPNGMFYSQNKALASLSYDFGTLLPTSSDNPNEFRLIPKDIYGLQGDEIVRQVQVQQFPGWLMPIEENMLSFNRDTLEYDIRYRNALLDVGPSTLDDLLGSEIPFVGNLENQLLAEVGANTSANLNPDEEVFADIYAHAKVVILGETVFEETYTPDIQINDYMSIGGTLVVNSNSLDSDFLAITFSIDDLPLFDFQSPEITLFAYGVPGIASINANLQFSLDATLDAAVTVGIRQSDGPLSLPSEIGLASPTYVAPTVTAGLSVSGEVEVLGFDLAELSGSIYLSITPAYGLESPRSQLIGFHEFFDHDCFQVTGSVWGGISAKVLGMTVFDFQLDPIDLPIPSSCTVVTDSASRPLPGPNDQGVVTIPGGDDLVGLIQDFAHPELVIDPETGEARFVQLVDVDPDAAIVRHGIAHSERSNVMQWSDLTTIDDPGQHQSNPLLAMTNDDHGAPAVLVYQSLATNNPAQLTRNQFFTGQELHYRYYDGSSKPSVLRRTSCA